MGASGSLKRRTSAVRVVHSLRFRINIGVLFPLLAVLAASSYFRYDRYQRLLMSNLERAATTANEIIESGLQQAMMANDFAAVREIVADIGSQRDVTEVFLLDKQGRVTVSTGSPAEGAELDRSGATCQVCHQTQAASRSGSAVTDLGDGVSAYRNANAIENAPRCRRCHSAEDSRILGVLISDLDMEPVRSALAVSRRSSVLWSAASLVLISLIVNLMMDRLVLSQLRRFMAAIRLVARGDLGARVSIQSPDEYALLAASFNEMIEGIGEKQSLEASLHEQAQELRAQTERLSTLNALAQELSQPLDRGQIARVALEKVLESVDLSAGAVFLGDGPQETVRLIARSGPDGEGSGPCEPECTWDRCLCREAFESGRPLVCRGSAPQCPGRAMESGAPRVGNETVVCIPIASKDRVLGVMRLRGDRQMGDWTLGSDALDMLTAVGRQVGIAIENSRLLETLRQTENRQRQLLERVISVQEEERKRVARELHDQTGQPLSSLIMTLEVLEQSCELGDVAKHVADLREIATGVLDQVHDLALELRPSMLDDLGLIAALRHTFRQFQHRFRLPVDFQVLGLDRIRLTPEIETTLFRITQEALTNVAKHAQARNVGVLLENRGTSIVLMVEDDGRGFLVEEVMGSRVQSQNLGLYGMQERASLVGGRLSIESVLGEGTAVFVDLPIQGKDGGSGEDQPADSG